MKKKSWLLIAAIILISCSLRGPITGVGPLLSTIAPEFNLSGTAASLLTTLPLLMFAVISFFTGPLSRKIGAGRLMLIALFVLGIGLVFRSFLGLAGLFAGSVLIGLGIGVNNVLLPPVIGTAYPEKMGLLMGLYTTFMAGFASLSTGISYPLAQAFGGWNYSLFIWIIIAVLAIITWAPNSGFKIAAKGPSGKRTSVARSPITWYISLFMGFQSILFYCFVAWFSTILQSKGYDPTTAGILNMVTMLCGLPGSFIMPIIAQKTKHQSFWGAFIGLCYTAAMVGAIFAENIFALIIVIITYGFGSGAAIAFCMVLFNLHTRDAEDASSLSGFAQGVGYIMAAFGPILLGALSDATGQNWTISLLILAGIGVICTICGWLSGRPEMVQTSAIE